MIRLLFTIHFLTVISIINAEHLNAFLWKDENWDNYRLKTNKGKEMRDMKQDDTIIFYYASGWKMPSCTINIKNGEIDDPNVVFSKGDSFNKHICIIPEATLYYFNIYEDQKDIKKKCIWSSYTTPDYLITDTTASCNDYGCITRFGWVYNKDLSYDIEICRNYVAQKDDMQLQDNNWMSYLNPTLKLNQINIPGTHDTGTYDIGQLSNSKILNAISERSPLISISKSFIYRYATTQNYNVRDQLEAGIRYLDIRLALFKKDSKDLYLCHGFNYVPCIDVNLGDILYFTTVLDQCVEFLIDHPLETIVMHLKGEDIPSEVNNNKLGEMIANLTINNKKIIGGKNYYKYFYHSRNIPRLEEARGKIVIVSRSDFNNFGIYISVPSMSGCHEYSHSGGDTDKEECYPVISDKNSNYLIQDNYNLEQDDKWDLVYQSLMNRIPSRTSCKKERDFTYYEKSNTYQTYSCGKDKDTKENKYIKIYNQSITNKFHEKSNNLLNINFMNMAIAGDWWDNFELLTEKTIGQKAAYVNKNLVDFNGSFYNNWFILDFPTSDVIRKVYLSNELSSSYYFDSIKNSKISINNPNFDFNLSSNDSVDSNYYKDLNIYFDNKYYIYKKIINDTTDNEINLCIQRKLKNNKKNKEYVVKTNFECVDNSRNKWYFKKNNEYLNIISAFDDKCLLYKNNKLTVGGCDSDYNDFIINNNKKLCSKINKNNCLDEYELMPVPLERKEYQNLDCHTEIVKLGYQCCSSSAKIDHTDVSGTWGYENGELCGIPFDTLDLQDNID